MRTDCDVVTRRNRSRRNAGIAEWIRPVGALAGGVPPETTRCDRSASSLPRPRRNPGRSAGRHAATSPDAIHLALRSLVPRDVASLEGRSSGSRFIRFCAPSQSRPEPLIQRTTRGFATTTDQWHDAQIVPGYSDGLAPDSHRLPAGRRRVDAAIPPRSTAASCARREGTPSTVSGGPELAQRTPSCNKLRTRLQGTQLVAPQELAGRAGCPSRMLNHFDRLPKRTPMARHLRRLPATAGAVSGLGGSR
jgi:hypothetical protein